MAVGRKFARIPTRVAGYARITSSLDDAPRFTMAAPTPSPAASLEGSKLPPEVIKFLTGLDEKLDMLLSQQSLALVERDYPIRLDIREISGDSICFLPNEDVEDGCLLEVVMLLRKAPIRLAVGKGAVSLHTENDNQAYCSLDFESIRDNDLETLVSFTFEEEREQLRRRNKISG